MSTENQECPKKPQPQTELGDHEMIAVIFRKDFDLSWDHNKLKENNKVFLERIFLGESAIEKAESYMKEKNLCPTKYELITGDLSQLEPFEVKVIIDDKENKKSTEFNASVERGLRDIAEGRTYTEEVRPCFEDS